MAGPLKIRLAGYGDYRALSRINFRSIRLGARGNYSPAQRMAWAPGAIRPQSLRERFAGSDVFVAEQNGFVVGFMTLDDSGYIDFAYVDPGAIGLGVASALYAVVEAVAIARGVEVLSVHASLMAAPRFVRFGFGVLERDVIERFGQKLPRFAMEKVL